VEYLLTLKSSGKTVAHYVGQHPVSGVLVSVYLPYDEEVTRLDTPSEISVLIRAKTWENDNATRR